MKISQLFKDTDKTVFSFEVFPPKKDSPIESVYSKLEEICSLKPDFISVTYGAGGTVGHSRTAEIASKIKNDFGVESVAHLTCVNSTKSDIDANLDDFVQCGIENILALRGDIPANAEFPLPNQYHHASELIAEIKEQGDFCIGGACYPEGHPDAANKREDIQNLKKKVDAGCEFLTTQMFFDNNIFYNFLYRAREAGINVPIIPVIMPITRASQVKNAVKLSGCNMPERFINIVDHFGKDKDAMQQAGIIYATDQIIDLIANGITNIHVYSMNNSRVAQGIQENLSAIL